MATEVMVCVVGPSRGQGHVFKSGEGVGKSCLCYRFLHPGFDDFISEHPSIIASHEFQSAAVNNVHFLYWGRSRQNLPGRLGRGERTVDIHVVENTVLYEDVTSKPFRSGGSKADNLDTYMKRALGKLESPGKISYWTRDGISLPDTYKAQRYPTNAGKMRRGFAVVVDVGMDGMEFDAQLQRTKLICKTLKKADAAYVLVLTKMESVVQESVDKLHQLKKKEKIGADIITTSSMCNYNIAATFRIITEKILKTMYVNIPTFEQAADNELAAKTSAKRLFSTFTTKWVQASSERIEEIELTEQYRACKRAVGKYETERIFAFKLLEVKNSEMLVGVNEDPDRRREYLEDFIQMHPDLMLYQSQLLRKVEEYVADSLLEQPATEISSPPRTPRRVHHYPSLSSDEGSKHSSTASSPAVKPKMATSGAGQPERQLSVASAASLGTSSVEDTVQGAGTSDTHSIGSFDSDDGQDYINMHGYTKNGSHTLPSNSISDSALPLPIPPLESCNAVAMGNEGGADNQLGLNAQSGTEPSSPSADKQPRQPTLPSTVSSMEAGNQSQDGVAGGNQDAPSGDGVLVTASSEEALYEDTAATSRDGPSDSGTVAEGSHEIVYSNTATGSKDGPSGNGTVTAEILYQNTTAEPEDKPLDNGAMATETGEMLYQNTIRETRDDPLGNETKDVDTAASEEILYENTSTDPKDDESGNQTLGEHQAGDETSHAKDNSTSPSHLPDKNTHPQVDTNKSPSKVATTTGDKVKPQPAPKPLPGATKTKPTPPPRKPKPKRQSKVEKPVNNKQATSPSTSPYPPPPLSPPTHQMRISSTTPSSPPNSVQDISSSIDKKLKISIPPIPDESPPLPPHDSKSATEDENFSSGDEYVPSDYETDGEQEPEKKEEKEPTPVGDREATPPPPPIPLRTKNYHLVVLDKGKSKEDATKPSNTSVQSSPHTSPVKVVESTPANRDTETADNNKDSAKSPKRKRRFYDAWKLKGEKSKKVHSEPKSPEKERSPPKETKEPQKKKGLKHSQSDRQGAHIKSVRRVSTSSRPPVAHRSLPREPRTTFLNMRTRPLPDAPFAMPRSPPPEHTLEDYDIVGVMFPTSQSFDSSRWPQFLGSPGLPSPNSPHRPPQRQRSQSHDILSADNMDYLNEDQFPRPPPSASVHPLSAASVRSPPAPSYPLPSSPFSTTARHAGQQPFASGWNPSPAQFNQPPMPSLPPSFFQRHLQPVSEPAHPLGVAHPLPPSARQPPQHIPLDRSTSNPNRGQSPPSPDYSYPRIPLDLMRILPSRLQGATSNQRTTFGIPRSKSTEEEEYVQMKRLSGADDTDDQQYMNYTIIESIRDTKRSRSMEDIHEYQNFPVKQKTVFDRTLPLPSRNTQQTFVLPPRNLPRDPGAAASLSPPPLQSLPPVKSPPSSMNQLPSQDSVTPAQMQSRLLPRPTPRTQREQLVMQKQPSSFPPPHTQHVITTSPLPPPTDAPRESPPHLEYVPKYKSPPSQPISSFLVGPPHDNRQQGSNFKPPPRSLPVGTSTWTADDDPNYYNVVSKSFLFSKPKPPMSPEDNSYLDIIPD